MRRHNACMVRRAFPGLLLLGVAPLVLVAGCGGNGAATSSAMAPVDPTLRSPGADPARATSGVFQPAVGTNVPLGTLHLLSESSLLLKPATGKAVSAGAASLAKLPKDGLLLNDKYSYVSVGPDAPKVAAGEKGEEQVPLPADAKINPDGSVWVIDAEARHFYELTGIKKEEGKPTTVASATNVDLVHPAEGATTPLGIVLRADQATAEIKHALRLEAKGVGGEGAPAASTRIRLKGSVSEKGLTPLTRSIVRALKKYGAVLVPGDGGAALSALADPRWTKEDRAALAGIHLTDFELPEVKKTPVKNTGNNR